MFVKVLQNFGIAGEHCGEGELLNLEDADAKQMISYGRVREASKREIADAQKKPNMPPSGDAPAGGQGQP